MVNGRLCMRVCEKNLATGILVLLVVVMKGHGGLILQDYSMMGRVFSAEPYGFLGQSFTAEDQDIAFIGIGVHVYSPQIAERSITMSLYAGAGNQGPLLGTATVTPPADGHHTQWVDFAFPGVTLNPGSVYTFTCLAESRYWGGAINQYMQGGTPLNGFDYTGGQLFDPIGFLPLQDMRFRVVPVPEPSVFWIGGAGIGLVWLNRLRRSGKGRRSVSVALGRSIGRWRW